MAQWGPPGCPWQRLAPRGMHAGIQPYLSVDWAAVVADHGLAAHHKGVAVLGVLLHHSLRDVLLHGNQTLHQQWSIAYFCVRVMC